MGAEVVSLLFFQKQIVKLLPNIKELVCVIDDGLALGGATEVEMEKAHVFIGSKALSCFVVVVVQELL